MSADTVYTAPGGDVVHADPDCEAAQNAASLDPRPATGGSPDTERCDVCFGEDDPGMDRETIRMPPALRADVEAAVEAGVFANKSEAIRAAIRGYDWPEPAEVAG
jgi:hypothetical protein